MAAVLHQMKAFLCRRRNEDAFTLIELLVVCLLISIMLVVSVPSLRDALLTDELKTTTRKIIGTVQGLREEAVRGQQPYMLYFDMEKKCIWYEKDTEIQQDGYEEKKTKTPIQVPSSVRTMDVWTKSDGKQSQGTAGLWISRQGYMDMTVIHLTDESNTMSIFFSPFLGSIKVVDGYADLE